MKSGVVVGATGNIGKALQKSLMASYILDPLWLGDSRPRVQNENAFDLIPNQTNLGIYAAGINVVKPLEDMSNSDWDSVFEINVTAAFRFAKAMERKFPDDGSGVLVFISSIMSTHPYPNRLAYASSKGAIESLTKALAVEANGKFSTFGIRLGHIDALMSTTKTNPKLLEKVKSLSPGNELTQPREVADLIRDLIPHARLINGAIIDADRGYTINRWPL
jgi:NAD(P)-dependent dehydrogenase (short-subunit alcohol dehydrogenase family)